MECTSGAELLELVGTGNDTIDKLEKMPQSFWIHPHLLTAYVTQHQSKIESIGDSFVLAIEDMDDNSATKLTEQYYHCFLVFIWAIGNGHARTQIKLSDPPDDDTTDLLLEKAQAKFRSNKAREGKGSDDSDNEAEKNEAEKDDNNRPRHNHERSSSREGHRTTRPRSPARRRNHRDNTNTRGLQHSGRRARGRRSHSNTRSRSQGRGSLNSSSSSGSSSRDRGRDRNHGNRSRSPNRGREHSPDDQDIIHQLTRGVSALAQVQNDNLRKDRVEKSVLVKLSERQKDLFTLLATKDWYDTHPTLNRATERLLSSRVPENQWNLIENWSREWPGLVSKQGVVQFLSSGYASKNLPAGGFMVFIFAPLKHHKPLDKKDRVRNIRGTFGKEGSLDDEAVDFYATLDYFVPTSLSDAETQLEMAVHLLEALTHRQGIAIDGYLRGLDIIAKHRLQMYEELAKEKMIVARFLHFLDVVFNNFCDNLAEYHTQSNPIESACRRLRGRMKDDIDRVMRDIHHGITPNLPLPSILEREETGSPKRTKRLPPASVNPREKKTRNHQRGGARTRKWWRRGSSLTTRI
jgi:hypothetical protein